MWLWLFPYVFKARSQWQFNMKNTVKRHMILLICGIKEIKQRKRQTRKQTLTYREQTGSGQRGGEWGDGWKQNKTKQKCWIIIKKYTHE